jgi:hypothetical protein
MQRVHGTTRTRVSEALVAEKPHLQPIAGRASFPVSIPERRQVACDAYVSYRTNRYSVPWRVVGQEVLLREIDGHLEITRDGERLARHRLCPGRYQIITIAAHHADMPASAGTRRGKAQITLCERAPRVEVRDLGVYEALA